MPRWGEHLMIANKILNKNQNRIKIDKNLFLFGNILPDVQDGYLIKDISHIVKHTINHYDFNNGKNVYENFYDKYCNQLDNSIVLGYLSHLMTDYLWNKMFDERCIIDSNNEFIGYYNSENQVVKKDKENARLDKQTDFRIFENYIFCNFDVDIPKYNENILKNCNSIKTVNINKEDIEKVLNYINNLKDNLICNENLKIFNKEELESYMELSSKRILN